MNIIINNPKNPHEYIRLNFTFHPDVQVFMVTHEGEGMGMTYQSLYDLLRKYFDSNM